MGGACGPVRLSCGMDGRNTRNRHGIDMEIYTRIIGETRDDDDDGYIGGCGGFSFTQYHHHPQ